MWNEEDLFGEPPVSKILVSPTQFVGYHRVVDQLAEEDAMAEVAPRRLALNGLMQRPAGAPDNWIFNVKTKHQDNGDQAECMCKKCVLGLHPELTIGEPVATADWPSEELKGKGIVGVYKPPPPYSKPCPICGTTVNLYSKVHDGSEVVHVHCLGDEERELLRNVGYSDPHMIRRKHVGDRRVDGASSNHECSDSGGSGQGGEPVQDPGGEGSSLAEEGREAESPDQRSKQRGVDFHLVKTGEGAEARPEQADAGGEEAHAGEDPGQAPVLHAAEVEQGARD